MNQAISTSSLSSLQYASQLWNPNDILFIVSISIIGLFLMGIIYLLPLYFARSSPEFKRALMIKDMIFIVLFSWIYLILISNAGRAISNLTLVYFQYDVIALYTALFLSFIIGRIFFAKDSKWTIYIFSLMLVLLVILNICFSFYLAYNL